MCIYIYGYIYIYIYNVYIYPKPYRTIKLNYVTDINTRITTIKLVGKIWGGNICDLGWVTFLYEVGDI